MPTINPTGDRILIERIPDDAATSGGILIPEMHRRNGDAYVVHAVGPKVPPEIKRGSRVIVKEYAASVVIVDGRKMGIASSECVEALLGVPSE